MWIFRLGVVLFVGLSVGCRETPPYLPPVCVKSHMEVVPKHMVGYIAGTRMGHGSVILYEAPESVAEHCELWVTFQ